MKVVNTGVTEEIWVDNPDDKEVKVKIRRFPLSLSLFAPNEPDGVVKLAWQRFDYCIVDWQGFVDQDENTLECNSVNKKIVFDFNEDIMIWVANEINKLNSKKKV